MGLGCGNPSTIASLKPGEIVLDLGSGGGFDCLLASRAVGENGKVIGVDMTPEMLVKARDNAKRMGARNVEFRMGEIEHLPIDDMSVDVIISNCVINLSPEKGKVFREAFRVLKPGGRLAVSDVVASRDLPDEIKRDLALVTACMGGAETVDTMQRILEETGFQQIKVAPIEESARFIREWLPESGIENYIISATIEAVKPLDPEPKPANALPGKNPMEPQDIKKKTYGLFKSGYLCAEAVSTAVLGAFGQTPGSEVMRCASAFCGGVGGTTEDLCGAYTGSVLTLGYLLGREKPGESLEECGFFIRQFRKEFLARFGSLNCSTLLKGFERGDSPALSCVQLSAQSGEMLAGMLMEAAEIRGIDLSVFRSSPRNRVELGCCPFSAPKMV
jgi:C_GCAxxG_C_C family probable redox protein